MATLTEVTKAARKATAAAQERDAAIRAASASGETIRAVATAAGISASRVHQILHGR